MPSPAALDAFHVVKLGTQAVDEVRRRAQQNTLGHRGRRGDVLYGIGNILRCGRERLTAKQNYRLHAAFAARGFRHRDNYRLRMPLISGGLTHPHPK